MICLNPNQQAIYNAIVNHIATMQPGDFCLDKAFYNQLQVSVIKADRLIIGKYFKEQVAINAVSKVRFHYIFSNCLRCGYKDSSNKIHYEKY